MADTDVEGKLNNYLEYLKSDPDNTNLLLDTAQLYLRLGRFDDAQALIEKGRNQDPNNPQFDFVSATIAMASNHPERAVPLLENLLQHGVDNAGVRYNLAYSKALLGDMETANAVLQPKLAEISAQAPESSILLARIKHYLGDLDAGISLVKGFLFENPQHPRTAEAQGVLALLYLDNENIQEAGKYAKLSVERDVNNIESQITLGNIALADLEPEAAEQYFDKTLQRDSNNGRAWLGKGLTAMLKQDLTAAEFALQQCVENMPSHLGSWNTLAWCQISANKIDAAEDTLLKAMDIDHNFSETHGGLAVVAIIRRNLDEANEHIKRALGLDKNSFSGNYARSLLLAEDGHVQSAQGIVTQLLQTPIGKNKTTITAELQKLARKNRSKQAPKNYH